MTIVEPPGGDRGRAVGTPIAAWCGNYACGRMSRETVLGLLLPLAILSFVVGTGLAVAAFPTPYHIGYRWISSLAAVSKNPSGYFYFGVGLSALGVLLMPVPGYLSRLVRAGRAGVLLLWAGIAGTFLLGLEITFSPNVSFQPSVHRILTNVTFAGLTLGFVSFAALSVSRAFATRSNRWPACLICALLSAPALGGALTYLLIEHGANALGWTTPREATHAAPFFLRLTFWEWAAVASLFAGGYLTVWQTSQRRPEPQNGAVLPGVRGALGTVCPACGAAHPVPPDPIGQQLVCPCGATGLLCAVRTDPGAAVHSSEMGLGDAYAEMIDDTLSVIWGKGRDRGK